MNGNKFKAVIFDMDGVLIESLSQRIKSSNQLERLVINKRLLSVYL